jgi:hypothetical protein
MERAMEALAESDDNYAEAKAAVLRTELLCKKARARVFLIADGGAEQRKATAEASGDAQTADDAYIAATLTFERLRVLRQRAELLIDVWRSLEASRRKI